MFKTIKEYKERLRGLEVASVATQEISLSLARMSSARSSEVKTAFHTASRQLKGRADNKSKRIGKLNWLQVRCLKALGIYWVIEDQPKDIEAIATHFRFAGDVQNKLSDRWAGRHFELAATDIQSRVPHVLEIMGKEGAEDLTRASLMVRGMRDLVDPSQKEKVEGGDDASQANTSKA